MESLSDYIILEDALEKAPISIKILFVTVVI